VTAVQLILEKYLPHRNINYLVVRTVNDMSKKEIICRFNRIRADLMKLNLALICKLFRRILKEKSVQKEWVDFLISGPGEVISHSLQVRFFLERIGNYKTLKSL
jgi:hypothetical protein